MKAKREKTADVDLWLSDPLTYSIDLDDPAALAELRRRVQDADASDGPREKETA